MMDAVNDPLTHTVVIMTSAQIGKTEAINNVVGFFIHHEPSPLLNVQPTVEMAETWSKDRLKEFGAQVGVDTKAFGQCLDGRKFKDKVAADIADGTKLALRGTPTFFLNGQQLPLNFETILQAVNEEVKKQ